MARAAFLSAGLLCAVLACVSLQFAAAETSPMVAWASNDVFMGRHSHPIRSILGSADVDVLATALAGGKVSDIPTGLEGVLASSSKLGAVVVFVQDALSMGDISAYCGAYGNSDAPYSDVRTLTTLAKSSVVASRIESNGNVAEDVIARITSKIDGRVYQWSGAESYEPTPARTDLIVVRLDAADGLSGADKTAALARNDKTIKDVSTHVLAATSAKYAGVLLAERASSSFYSKASPRTVHSRRAAEGVAATESSSDDSTFDPQQAADGGQLVGGYAMDDDTSGWVFFTFPIFMGIITMFLLILILLLGVGALFSLQTPSRFDDPRGKPIQLGK
eukprot:Opistho-2@48086